MDASLDLSPLRGRRAARVLTPGPEADAFARQVSAYTSLRDVMVIIGAGAVAIVATAVVAGERGSVAWVLAICFAMVTALVTYVPLVSARTHEHAHVTISARTLRERRGRVGHETAIDVDAIDRVHVESTPLLSAFGLVRLSVRSGSLRHRFGPLASEEAAAVQDRLSALTARPQIGPDSSSGRRAATSS